MTDIDFSKIKAGDTVGLVVDHVSGDGEVLVKDGWGTNIVRPSAIVSHTPAPRPALEVGDRVRTSHHEREVGMIVDGYVYFRPTAVPDPSYAYPLAQVETWERLS